MNLQQYLKNINESLPKDLSEDDKTREIKDHFNKLAYNVNFPLQLYLDRLLYYKGIIQNNEETIQKYEYLKRSTLNILDKPDVLNTYIDPESPNKCSIIDSEIETMRNLNRRVMLIKYTDGTNQLWSEPWHFQTRNVLCIKIDGAWNVVSVMPRGPEVAGHSDKSIVKLQDLDISEKKSKDKFTPQIQNIIESINGFKKNTSSKHSKTDDFLEVVASSKRDGMCFRLFSFDTSSMLYPVILETINIVNHPLINSFKELSLKLSGDKRLLLPASNGTLFLVNPSSVNWILSSIALSYGMSHEKICQIRDSGLSSIDMVTQLGILEEFVTDALRLDMQNSEIFLNADRVHMFESIGGPNRQCAFDNEPHLELATSYTSDQCGLSYLGTSMTSNIEDTYGDLIWLPHFELKHNFSEPTFWNFGDLNLTRLALNRMTDVFAGKIEWDTLFSEFPRGNGNVLKTFIPDAEGFVLYVKVPSDSGKEGIWIYCKAKTWMYYMLHKIKSKDLHTIISMPKKFGEPFPDYQTVLSFFDNHKLFENLILELSQTVLIDNIVYTISGKCEGALKKALVSNNKVLAYKIALSNVEPEIWEEFALPIAEKYFDKVKNISDTLKEHKSAQENMSLETFGQKGLNFIEMERLKYEILNILKSLLMETKSYDDKIWRNTLMDSLNIEKIKKSGNILRSFKKLWDFLYK